MGGGGCAFNVALNLAIFDNGLELYALGVIGNDSYGDFLIDQFRKYTTSISSHSGGSHIFFLRKTEITFIKIRI